jgi:outer membrane receptor protein involved in Fe transport
LLGSAINEFKIGYNAAPSTYAGVAPAGLEGILVSLSGTVANAGIAGQSGSSGIATPGQLVRVNSAGNGRSAPYDPYSLTIADSMSRLTGNHFLKFGGDVRMIRMSTDQLGGTTYTYGNIAGFLANTPTQIQYFGDLSEPSPFHNGASGPKNIEQEYYVAYAQDEWRVRPNLTLNYGLRYDYYVPLQEADNRIVKFNIDTGTLDPDTTPLYQSKKTSFQPRVSATFSPTSKTVIRAGGGIFVGPGQTEDQIQPVEAERISTTVSSGFAYPIDPALVRPNFINNPNNRAYQPRAYANEYTLPEKVYQYTASVQQELSGSLVATAAYVGSQGRNLFLRSIANRTIGVDLLPNGTWAQIREFDIVSRNADGTLASIQRPYAEIDYKTSGGHDTYNAMQLSLTRRAARGLTANAQYTLGYSKGNTGGRTKPRQLQQRQSPRGLRLRGRVQQLRYPPHVQSEPVVHDSWFRAAEGWLVGRRHRERSQRPPDSGAHHAQRHRLRRRGGSLWNNAAPGRTAVINVPGGGARAPLAGPTSSRRRSVHPDGGRVFLNPAAFATPLPARSATSSATRFTAPTSIRSIWSSRSG